MPKLYSFLDVAPPHRTRLTATLHLLVVLCVVSLICILPGCATRQGGPAQSGQTAQAAIDTGAALAKGYFVAHNAYVALAATAEPALALKYKRTLAPVLNRTKRGIILYNDLALKWMNTGERPPDIDAALSAAQTLLAEAAAALKEVVR